MPTIEQINKKVNTVIEWILNTMPLLNSDTRKKLESMLVCNLRYYKDSHGNTLKIEIH